MSEDIFNSLIKSVDRAFNTVSIYTPDVIQILDDLYEFQQVMHDNGYDYELNERDGKTDNDLKKRISDLGHSLIGRKEFDEYLETEDINMLSFDRGYYEAKNQIFKEKLREIKEKEDEQQNG